MSDHTDLYLVCGNKCLVKYSSEKPLTGTSAPTTSTVGEVDQLYVNTSTGDIYVCTAVSGSMYTWVSATPTMRSNISDKARLSVKSNITLASASWSDNKYTISNTNITTTSVVELLPRENGGITQAQMEALSGAMIVGGTQAAGSIQLIALGDVPTVDIPVTIIIRGDL